MKLSQKNIKEMVERKLAIDITYCTDKEIQEIKVNEGWFNELGYSAGVYGCNGLLLQGNKTKQLYAITSRTSAVYCI